MDCGPNEFFCQLLDWLARHPRALRQTLEFVDGLWNEAGGQLIKFLKDHGEKLVAIASFSFGVWRWWIYRERILHKRLEEYIRESDARLKPASEQAIEALLRPSRTAALPQPAFALELLGILEKNGWQSFLKLASVERQAERKLGSALRGLRKRQQIARAASQSLLEQQAQVHLLAGAIATSRARRKAHRVQASRDDHVALREFRKVLQFAPYLRDVGGKELEAFQLLRLGKRDEAMNAYIELEDYAGELSDHRQRDLTIARAKRFRAQIYQSNAGEAGSNTAWDLIANNQNGECSIQLRSRHSPFIEWDAIEQGEIHYVAAWIAHRRGFVIEEPAHLSRAEAAFSELLAGLPKRRWLVSHFKRRLRDEARAGLERAAAARRGDYHEQWLLV